MSSFVLAALILNTLHDNNEIWKSSDEAKEDRLFWTVWPAKLG